jgi:phosphoglycolate phosphatase
VARTLLFDLDGTLVDTLPDLAAALNRLMRSRGLPDLSKQQVAAMIGDGIAMLVARAFAAHDRQPDATAVSEMSADYTAHVAIESKAYPEVLPVLAGLAKQGWRLAVCTNKPEQAARDLLKAVGLLPLLCAIGGGDSFSTRKPDPAHLLATLARADGRGDAAVMVGDHCNDIRAARGAGIPSIFAAWGYGAIGMADGSACVAHTIAEAAVMANHLMPDTR